MGIGELKGRGVGGVCICFWDGMMPSCLFGSERKCAAALQLHTSLYQPFFLFSTLSSFQPKLHTLFIFFNLIIMYCYYNSLHGYLIKNYYSYIF